MMDLMQQQNDDHEASMARADLFKCAQYSFKLFKMIHDGQQLEGWVQAKITKAADYIASVYHYMEYEMKFSEYGEQIENSDMYSESQRAALKNMLTEAKSKMKELTKAQAKKIKEANLLSPPDGATAPPPKGKDGKYPFVVSGPNKGKRWSPQTPGPTNPAMKEATKAKKDYDGDGEIESPKDEVWGSRAKAAKKAGKPFKENMKVGDTKKTRTGELTKTKTGVVHKRTDYKDDEHGEAPSTVKQKSAAEKKADKSNDIKLPKHSGNTWGMKGGEKFGKKTESAKPDFLDMDKDGDKKEPMKKAVKDKKVDEAGKPSAGMSAAAKSALAKKASAGKDIGKPGKSFDKVAKAAGGGEKGKKIAAAAMWKNAAK
jgi:hypothetical protein